MSKDKKMLSDHKRIGKKFIPPFIAKLGPLEEVKWTKQLLPEILWLGLLNECFGFQKGASLSLCLPSEVMKVVGDKTKNYAFVSSYKTISDSQKKIILNNLNPDQLQDLRIALSVFKYYYPAFPLSFIFDEMEKDDLDLISELRNFLLKVFDRKSLEATFMQANAIYINFDTERLKVATGLALAEFPKIQDYPNTEISKKIASGVRATLNILISQNSEIPSWPNYFWNRGFELEECYFNDTNKC